MNGHFKNFSDYLALSRQPVGKAALWRGQEVQTALATQPRNSARATRALALTRADAPPQAFGLNESISLIVQALGPGEKGKSHSHSFWHLYFVLKGQGSSTIDGEPMAWAAGDVFFVPPWAEHDLANLSDTDEAIVYSTQNLPQHAYGGTLMRDEAGAGQPAHIRSDSSAGTREGVEK